MEHNKIKLETTQETMQGQDTKKVSWTEDQQHVIDIRDCNTLVSAAAGSGKTAVLVERILKRVESGADIDDFLVVTFTKAAAAQMKGKLRKALEAIQEQNPGNPHIIKQLSLIHHADITTIDSFCKGIVDEYFEEIGLDPATQIMDETEAKLLREDIFRDLLEFFYNSDSDNMVYLRRFLGCKTDADLIDILEKIAIQADSFPYPEHWLATAREEAEQKDEESIKNSLWMQELIAGVQDYAKRHPDPMRELLDTHCEIADSLGKDRNKKILAYGNWFSNQVTRLAELTDYEEIRKVLQEEADGYPKGYRSNYPKVKGMSDQQEKLLEQSAAEWNAFNETYKNWQKRVFGRTMNQILAEQKQAEPVLVLLIRLAAEFRVMYQTEKQKRRRMTFADVEHYALRILRREDGEATTIATQLKDKYQEILIDEYQDSNDLQESILTAVAKTDEDGNYKNLFMVGDLKQSIYRFRLARPQLFRSKYDTYDKNLASDADSKCIELNKNFRSRKEVLDSVNDVFRILMSRAYGGIDYEDSVALHLGRDIVEPPEGVCLAPKTELLELCMDEEDVEETQEDGQIEGDAKAGEASSLDTRDADSEEEDSELAEMEKLDAETYLIAGKIKELTDPMNPHYIWDEDAKQYRPCRLSDIVILLRGIRKKTETIVRILQDAGIPAYAESDQGYFDSVEICNLLNILTVIDNSHNDTALTGCLLSPMYGVTNEELIDLRLHTGNRKLSMVDAIRTFLNEWDAREQGLLPSSATTTGEKEKKGLVLAGKLRRFVRDIADWKERKVYLPIRELLQDILTRTGYLNYVTAMPSGERRRENILLLMDKAGDYENTSYKGLFDFLRYIARMKVSEQDFSEAKVLGEQENLVRIMTIHKSKGLEFPIVFVAGCGSSFVGKGPGPCMVDADHYLAVKDNHPDEHYTRYSLKRQFLENYEKNEQASEELRILYVAMTRAREKLILVGNYKNRGKKEGYPTPSDLASCKTYLDWLRYCMDESPGGEIPSIEYRTFRKKDLVIPVHEEEQLYSERMDLFRKLTAYEIPEKDRVIDTTIEEHFAYHYPHKNAVRLRGKLSVTEIKKMSQLDAIDTENRAVSLGEAVEEANEALMKETLTVVNNKTPGDGNAPAEKKAKTEADKPSAGKKRYDRKARDKSEGGAKYGTLMHLVMEKIAFAVPDSVADVEKELERLLAEEVLTEEEKKRIPAGKIYNMLTSSLGKSMAEANEGGKLFREAQFIIGMDMDEIYKTARREGEETLLVQGIIDAYYEEEDGLVLMDYKTDRVEKPEELVNLYHAQLESYKKTLEQLRQKKVKGVYIYSFALDQVIQLDCN